MHTEACLQQATNIKTRPRARDLRERKRTEACLQQATSIKTTRTREDYFSRRAGSLERFWGCGHACRACRGQPRQGLAFSSCHKYRVPPQGLTCKTARQGQKASDVFCLFIGLPQRSLRRHAARFAPSGESANLMASAICVWQRTPTSCHATVRDLALHCRKPAPAHPPCNATVRDLALCTGRKLVARRAR